MEEHCVRKESPRRSLAHLENVCRLRVNYTTVCRNPLVESRETPVSRQRHWLPQHRGGGRGEMMIFGGIPVPSHLVTKDDCGYHYDEFLPNNCAAVSASSRSHLSELRPRRIRKSFAGSRDSWLLDYTPPVLGEMYRCIRVLPWPECALIAIAPRPKGGCCAGISGRATATGLR